MAKTTIRSKTLELLDQLGIQYEIRNSEAKLLDWDSMSITLDGKYAGFWKRWSNGRFGRNHTDLLAYLVEEGIVEKGKASELANTDLGDGKKLSIEKVEPYDFETMVTDPQTHLIEEYFTDIRKINPTFMKSKIIDDLGLVVQDGRGSARFLWTDADKKITGAEVQGIVYDQEKYGKRGTLKYILPGSEGFFHIESSDIAGDFSKVKKIILFEAPIDLISFLELNAGNSYKEAMYISLSGVDSKIPVTIERLKDNFNIDIKDVDEVIVATDNDEPGNTVFDLIKSNYNPKHISRLVPNNSDPVLINGVSTVVNDWNDWLKHNKSTT